MSRLTRRKILSALGTTSTLGAVSKTTSAESDSVQLNQHNPSNHDQFGIFNNSDSEIRINVFIGPGRSPLFETPIELRGLNESDIRNPESANLKGGLDMNISYSIDNWLPVQAVTDSGKRAEGEVLTDGDSISEYASLSVYYNPDYSLEIKSTME